MFFLYAKTQDASYQLPVVSSLFNKCLAMWGVYVHHQRGWGSVCWFDNCQTLQEVGRMLCTVCVCVFVCVCVCEKPIAYNFQVYVFYLIFLPFYADFNPTTFQREMHVLFHYIYPTIVTCYSSGQAFILNKQTGEPDKKSLVYLSFVLLEGMSHRLESRGLTS